MRLIHYMKLKMDYSKDNIIKILKEIEFSSWGVYRKYMSNDEIKLCDKLVKDDYLYKSKPDEKNATIAFFYYKKRY